MWNICARHEPNWLPYRPEQWIHLNDIIKLLVILYHISFCCYWNVLNDSLVQSLLLSHLFLLVEPMCIRVWIGYTFIFWIYHIRCMLFLHTHIHSISCNKNIKCFFSSHSLTRRVMENICYGRYHWTFQLGFIVHLLILLLRFGSKFLRNWSRPILESMQLQPLACWCACWTNTFVIVECLFTHKSIGYDVVVYF